MRESGRASLLRLGANESSFGPSPKAIAAMTDELARLSWYADPQSYDLREALAARFDCTIENVCIGSGIDDLMGLAVRAFVGPGGVALTTRGTYPTFAYHVTGYGGTLVTVDYRSDAGVDVDALIERAKAIRPAIVYIANPDNPSGTLAPRADIERLLEAIPPQTLLLLDEAYAEFAPVDAFMPPLVHPRLLRMRTFSKAYGMAGARIGWAITDLRIAQTFDKIRLQYGINRNAQIGALAAFADDAFVNAVVAEVARGREDYYALASELGRAYVRSHTNFVCIDYGSAQQASAAIEAFLAAGVFIRKPFAAPLDGFIRVTVGTAEERRQFAQAMRSLKAA